jgi:outer membrane receptor protein involved in Fe transport
MTTYVSWQYGEKAGFSQTPNGIALLVQPEKTNSYEIGFKSLLFDKSLTFDIDFFYADISNYQQAVQVIDEYSTNLARQSNPSAPPTYISSTGNAAGVRALGVEIDGFYSGIPYTTISFNGAFNDASYTDFKNSARPPEQQYPGASPYWDVTGRNLPGAAKFTFNIGPEFRIPTQALGLSWAGNTEFHTSFNTSFTSRYNSDTTLSSYSLIPSNSYTDFAIGVGRRDKLFDFSFVSKNIFNNTTPNAITWNSYSPGIPQWFGVMVSGKL